MSLGIHIAATLLVLQATFVIPAESRPNLKFVGSDTLPAFLRPARQLAESTTQPPVGGIAEATCGDDPHHVCTSQCVEEGKCSFASCTADCVFPSGDPRVAASEQDILRCIEDKCPPCQDSDLLQQCDRCRDLEQICHYQWKDSRVFEVDGRPLVYPYGCVGTLPYPLVKGCSEGGLPCDTWCTADCAQRGNCREEICTATCLYPESERDPGRDAVPEKDTIKGIECLEKECPRCNVLDTIVTCDACQSRGKKGAPFAVCDYEWLNERTWPGKDFDVPYGCFGDLPTGFEQTCPDFHKVPVSDEASCDTFCTTKCVQVGRCEQAICTADCAFPTGDFSKPATVADALSCIDKNCPPCNTNPHDEEEGDVKLHCGKCESDAALCTFSWKESRVLAGEHEDDQRVEVPYGCDAPLPPSYFSSCGDHSLIRDDHKSEKDGEENAGEETSSSADDSGGVGAVGVVLIVAAVAAGLSVLIVGVVAFRKARRRRQLEDSLTLAYSMPDNGNRSPRGPDMDDPDNAPHSSFQRRPLTPSGDGRAENSVYPTPSRYGRQSSSSRGHIANETMENNFSTFGDGDREFGLEGENGVGYDQNRNTSQGTGSFRNSGRNSRLSEGSI